MAPKYVESVSGCRGTGTSGRVAAHALRLSAGKRTRIGTMSLFSQRLRSFHPGNSEPGLPVLCALKSKAFQGGPGRQRAVKPCRPEWAMVSVLGQWARSIGRWIPPAALARAGRPAALFFHGVEARTLDG